VIEEKRPRTNPSSNHRCIILRRRDCRPSTRNDPLMLHFRRTTTMPRRFGTGSAAAPRRSEAQRARRERAARRVTAVMRGYAYSWRCIPPPSSGPTSATASRFAAVEDVRPWGPMQKSFSTATRGRFRRGAEAWIRAVSLLPGDDCGHSISSEQDGTGGG
jgi:hypothetical protein